MKKLAEFHFARAAVPAVIVLCSATVARAGDMPPFQPHRAVYEISLLRSASGSGVSDMSGRMVYELGGSSCEGFTQNMRFVTRMMNQEGVGTINDLRTSSFEDLAQHKLRFSNVQYQNEALSENSQGDAGPAKGSSSKLAADLTKPGKKHVALPADIYFPMQHAAALIRAAKTGQTLFSAKLYDGSEKGDKYYLTTSVIGKKIEPGAVKNTAAFKDAARLGGVASWPVTISYFDMGQDKVDASPSYELSFRYYENGVTSDLKIDYGEFAIKGELKDLAMHESGKCPESVR